MFRMMAPTYPIGVGTIGPKSAPRYLVISLTAAERPTRLAAIKAHQSCAYRTGTLANRASSAEKTGDGKTAHTIAEGIAVAGSRLRGVYLSRPLIAASGRCTGTVAPLDNWAAIASARGAHTIPLSAHPQFPAVDAELHKRGPARRTMFSEMALFALAAPLGRFPTS
jgi:hypothetical protein